MSACGGDSSSDPEGDDTPDEDGIEIPRDAALSPLAYTLTPSYGEPEFLLDRPRTVTGHLYLEVSADGSVTGAISARESMAVGLAPVAGRVEGTEIVLQADAVDVAPGGRLGLDELRISLGDRDGDGIADRAQGGATGTWQRAQRDVVDNTSHTSALTAGLDMAASDAFLYVLRPVLTLLPYEAIDVYFEEPLREADVRGGLRILADGAPVTGEFIFAPIEGLVAAARFQPDAFLPLGAVVTVGSADLQDPSGNAVTAPSGGIPTVADPGPLADNAGFESGLTGWIAVGAARTEGEFEGTRPVEGTAQAVVLEETTLAAPLDVAADANELAFSISVLTETFAVDADRSVTIALRRPGGESMEIFDVAEVEDQLDDCTACTGGDYGAFVGPLRRSVDLTPYRGQRVFLTIDVRSSFFIGVNFFAALIDDVQLR